MRATIEKLLVSRSVSLYAALERLEETEEKILFVVDDSGNLYGTLTDGDVRRWILAKGSLDGEIADVCNARPKFVDEGYDLNVIKVTMLENNILCIPVLDAGRKIVELLFWEDVFGNKVPQPRKETLSVPVVIMAGGAGSRLDPFTRVLPKALVPLGAKTVIEIIIDSFLAHGVSAFYISVFNKSRIIKAYFDELSPHYTVSYLEEDKPLGTSGALRGLVGRVKGPLVVTNCDVLIKADYSKLIHFHRDNRNMLTLVASVRSYPIPYGICEIDSSGQLTRINEKPELRFLVNTGMYVVEEEALRLIPEGQLFHVTDLIAKLTERGDRVGVFPVGEKSWSDTGEWAEYKKTLSQFTLPD